MSDPTDPATHVTLTLGRDEAEGISYGLSDLLCWCRGFAAAKGDDTEHVPMGMDQAREINIKIKRALDRHDREAQGRRRDP